MRRRAPREYRGARRGVARGTFRDRLSADRDVQVALALAVREQMLFVLDQTLARVRRHLEVMAVLDRVLRTGFDAEAAKDAAAVVDAIHLGEPRFDTRPLGVGTRVVGAFDVDRVRRADRRAEKAGDTALA